MLELEINKIIMKVHDALHNPSKILETLVDAILIFPWDIEYERRCNVANLYVVQSPCQSPWLKKWLNNLELWMTLIEKKNENLHQTTLQIEILQVV